MRSLTELQGSIDSSLAKISAWHPTVTRFKRTKGVLPINSVTSLATLGRWKSMEGPRPCPLLLDEEDIVRYLLLLRVMAAAAARRALW